MVTSVASRLLASFHGSLRVLDNGTGPTLGEQQSPERERSGRPEHETTGPFSKSLHPDEPPLHEGLLTARRNPGRGSSKLDLPCCYHISYGLGYPLRRGIPGPPP